MPTLAAWLHDIDPYAIYLAGGYGIRWYGLSYLAGFLIGYALVRLVARRGRSPLTIEQAGDLVVTLAVSVVIGGRLGYVFFYKPSLLWTIFDSPPWWGVLAINEGGMASHGGMIGGAIGCLIFAYRQGLPKLFVGDLLAFGAPFGLALGRVANFINGELIGRVTYDGFPLAVKFPTAMRFWPLEKVQALMIAYQQQGGTLLRDDRPRAFVEHAIREIQSGNQQMAAVVRPMLEPRHPSQLYAALGEGVIVGLVLLWVYRKPRKPGVVGFTFLVVYAIARIIDELWRKPDAHIGFDWTILGWHITRGQWLSIAMLLIGVVGLLIVSRRKAEPLGGWLST
jgi:phosphatidylglycerol:prolipoprotein diacylglycerol transferase